MARIIKLENIQPTGELVEEYVCENCRHLIEPTDAVCWQCGEKLKPSSGVEHYFRGERLTEAQFEEKVAKYSP